MTARGSDGRADVATVVSDVLADPEGAEGALPALLSALDAADRRTRLQAAFGVCLVADAAQETVEPLTWRLVDRLADDAENLETRHALAYLRGRYPDRVREVLLSIAEAAAEREERSRHVEISRGFARSDYYGQSAANRDIGRTRVPGEGAAGPRRIYREEGEAVGGPPVEERDVDPDDLVEAVTGEAEEDGDGDSEAAQRRDRAEALELAAEAVGLDRIAERSRFDELHLVAPPTEGRYTTVYRTRAVAGTEEEGIAIRTFAVPEENGEAFVAAVGDALDDWAAVDDHDLVATLYDWGERPGLWVATEYADETLYDRVDLEYTDGLWNGLRLAEAVAHTHGRGVVHTGIDPDAVVYPGTTMADRPVPLLTNVGLLDAVRSFREPSDHLDPRFAAPEYFDRKYGTVDHATDVYHLGAVLYYLVTGRAPFRGSYEEVRSGVLSSRPPPPSEVNPEVPSWVDEVVAKATAKQKLTRYESATDLVGDLARELGDDA